MKRSEYRSYDELPLMLSVADVSAVLGISRAGAYELVKTDGFPSMKLGARIIVPKETFISWIKRQSSVEGKSFVGYFQRDVVLCLAAKEVIVW